MDMSKAIREGRDRLGMSQEALAERLGVSRQAVSKWEMGTSVPSPEKFGGRSRRFLGDRPSSGKRNSAARPSAAVEAADAGGRAPLPGAAAALGWILYSAHQDGWPPPEDPQITGVYFYDAAGQEIAKSDFGWYLFPPDSTVNVAVTFSGRPGAHGGSGGFVFCIPPAPEWPRSGSSRVRRIRDGRTFALFRWQIPASLYSHLEVQLECGDGQTISVSQWNVIDRDSAF